MRRAVTFSAMIAMAFTLGAQAEPSQNLSAPPASAVRYFRINDLIENVVSDAILRETKRGTTVTGATLDFCYPVAVNAARKDRLVVTLKPDGDRLVGSGATQEEKQPVTVSLKQTNDGADFAFEGTMTLPSRTIKLTSSGNNEQSEADIDAPPVGDTSIVSGPSDFSEVTPGFVSVRFKRTSFLDLLKALRAENVKLALGTVTPNCDELRSGEQTMSLEVDPERSVALVNKLKAFPGVTLAGWTVGNYNITYAVRLLAAEWRTAGGEIDRGKLATAISASLAKSLSATPLSSQWNSTTGVLTLTFKRPAQSLPGFGLTDTITATVLAGPERPAFNEAVVVWTSALSFTTADEGPEPRFSFTPPASEGEAESQPAGAEIDALVTTLARDLNGKRWDNDRSVWQQ